MTWTHNTNRFRITWRSRERKRERERYSTSVMPAQKHIQTQQAGNYLVFFFFSFSFIHIEWSSRVMGGFHATSSSVALFSFFRSLLFFLLFLFLDECYDTTGRCSGFFVPSQAQYLRHYALFPFTVWMASTKFKDRHCLPKQHTESHSRRYRGLL
ncbi:hypothetical protein GE21DRAFT_1061664 [Neurospora crassa]|nr:hypothetical protein GE21DRAFT_1061664 [Neurospora crassa]